jgi:hypothetical protein
MSAITDTKKVSWDQYCVATTGACWQCADIWLSGRHVADMSATFPAKVKVEEEIVKDAVKVEKAIIKDVVSGIMMSLVYVYLSDLPC